MKGQSLDQIDSTLINTGKFLLEFASEEKLRCLEAYCRCHNIVSWLRSNTKGKLYYSHIVLVRAVYCTWNCFL